MARTKVTRVGGAKLYRNSNFATAVRVDTAELRKLAVQLQALGEDQLREAFGAAHRVTADYVFGLAQGKAQSRRQSAVVANNPATFSREVITGNRAGVAGAAIKLRGGRFASFGTDNPNDPARFAFGAEFGANRNVNRQVKVKTRQLRAMGRVRKLRGRDSDLHFGSFRIMKGWNQFQPWRGGAQTKVGEGIEPGYFLFPAIVEARPTLNETYGQAALAEIRKRLKG